MLDNPSEQRLGNYHLLDVIGEGGFAKVYLGEHIYLKTRAALKVPKIHLAEEDLNYFLAEARTSVNLQHSHIVRVLECGVEGGKIPYLVMSYAPGGTLRRRYPKGSRLPFELILSYVQQVASALQYIHDKGLIHRDIKPENMLLVEDDTVLLSDFGIAGVAHRTITQNIEEVMGTARYMAPEQFRGYARPASDQYGLGVVVYEWICGEYPFNGSFFELYGQHHFMIPPPLHEKVLGIPPAVEEVVMRALAKEPHQRFARVLDFANALLRASQFQQAIYPVLPPPTPLPGTLSGWIGMPHENLSPYSAPSSPAPVWNGSQGNISSPSSPIPSTPPMWSKSSPSQSASSVHGNALPTFPSDRKKVPSTGFQQEVLQGQHSSETPRQAQQVPQMTSPSHIKAPGDMEAAPILPSQTGMDKKPGDRSMVGAESSPGQAQVHITPDQAHRGHLVLSGRPMLLLGLVFILVVGSIAFFSVPFFMGRTANPSQIAPSATHPPEIPPVYSPMFGSNLEHTRYNPAETVLNPTNVSKLTLYWKASTISLIYSSPVVANGIVYINSTDHNLYAFNAGAGTFLWKATTTNVDGSSFIFSSPAVVNGILYVGSTDGRLYAFNARTGIKLWTMPTGDSIYSSPAVANGVVYIGSNDHKLYAFNATTGSQIWATPTGGKIVSSPAVANGVVYVGSFDRKLYAFDAKTGSIVWTAPTGYSINSSPTVFNGGVYVGSDDGNLYAFDARGCGKATCSYKWQATVGSYIYSSPAIADNLLYVGSYLASRGRLSAFDVSKCGTSCAPLWTASVGNAPIESSPTVANGVVYVGSRAGNLYAFSASGCDGISCSPLWTYSTGEIAGSSPLVVNGIVYIGSGDHNLYAFHLPGTA